MRSGTGQAERAMGEAGGPCVPLWSGTSILHALPPTLSQSAPVLTGPHWPKTGGGFQASGMGRGLGLGTSHRISSSLQALGPMAVSYPPPSPHVPHFPLGCPLMAWVTQPIQEALAFPRGCRVLGCQLADHRPCLGI